MKRVKERVTGAIGGAYRVLVTNNLDILREEVRETRKLLELLCPYWNLGRIWSREELLEMKTHLLNIMKGIVTITILILPGGFLLLPLTGYFFRKKSGAV